MCSFPIRTNDPTLLKQKLLYTHGIEIPVIEQNNQIYIRISWQAFNEQKDADKLLEAIFQLQKEGLLL
jgi:selenocysteine lyase/cysteine desulfurase